MIQYARLERSSLYDDIADELERLIREEKLQAGHRLPSEQELSQKFGVSRNILREALKTLKARGLVSVRNGAGTFVERPTPKVLISAFDRFVRLTDVTTRHLFDLRCAIEVTACGLAAEHAEPTHIRTLETIIANMRAHRADVRRWTHEELAFHFTIAEATKNPLFPCFIEALTSGLAELFATGFYKAGGLRYGIEGHAAILAAIKARSKARAERAMSAHLNDSRKHLLAAIKARSKAKVKRAALSHRDGSRASGRKVRA
jgi:DNA-binding FadR family transcriptional regulator